LIKVLLADKLSQKAVDSMKEIPEFEIIDKPGISLSQLKDEIKQIEALVLSSTSTLDLNESILEKAQNLKILVKAGNGFDGIDTAYAGSKNIEVRNTPTTASIAAAEYTLARMLDISRNLGPAYKAMKDHVAPSNAEGTELHGKTAGIIGMGRIGKEVAVRVAAMGMTVIYYDIAEIHTNLKAKPVSLDELLETADFISIHVPLNPSTTNMLGAGQLEKIKEGVVLINGSPAGIVNKAALIKALDADKVRAVAWDIDGDEMDDDLIDHKKIFPAPRLSALTVEARNRADLDVISILKEFFNV